MAGTWPLIGREQELAAVGSVLADGSSVVVAGAAGVGKTRLAREALARVGDERGGDVLWSIATESASVVPFGAVSQLLPEAGVAEDRPGLLRATEVALRGRAADRALVVAVDDAHLLDEASAELVLRLASHRVVPLLVTVRIGEPAPDPVVALWKDGHATRLDLQALCDAELLQLAEAGLGAGMERDTRHWLSTVTQGNPLFLRELILASLGSGALSRQRGVWRLVGSPPPGERLAELVDARTRGLGPGARHALQLLAVGEPLPPAVLERLTDRAAVRELEHGSLLAIESTEDGPRARVAHPLHREVIASRVPELALARLRNELASALEAAGCDGERDAARIALWRLGAGERPGVGILEGALRVALRALDFEQAARLGEAALDSGAGLAAAVPLAHAYARLGRVAEAERVLAAHEEEAAAGGDAREYLQERLTLLRWRLGRDQEVYALLERAERWRGEHSWQDQLLAWRTVVLSDSRRFSEAAESGLRLLAEGTDQRALLSISFQLPATLVILGRTLEAEAVCERVVAALGPEAGRLQLAAWQTTAARVAARLESGRDWEGLDGSGGSP